MSLPTTHKPARLHYAWAVAAVTFLTLIVAAGVLLIGRGRDSAHFSPLQSGAATASAPN